MLGCCGKTQAMCASSAPLPGTRAVAHRRGLDRVVVVVVVLLLLLLLHGGKEVGSAARLELRHWLKTVHPHA